VRGRSGGVKGAEAPVSGWAACGSSGGEGVGCSAASERRGENHGAGEKIWLATMVAPF
jgi:hypothetical protein